MQRSHAMPFGAEIVEDGVRFALWAPSARQVEVLLEDSSVQALDAAGDGWWFKIIPEAGGGTRYSYRIDGDLVVPDPASRWQPEGPFAASCVVDPRAYEWQDAEWKGRPWPQAVIYETHVGTASAKGTYSALAEHLAELADLGVTALELMPLAECPGTRNWGYDGVLPFAPMNAYGQPDDLKRFIDRAHALGLMVLIDVVYNHFGPSGNFLPSYAAAFFTERHRTPWGAGLNFDGSLSANVRSFFLHNALYWLEEFHADGLRFDAVHAILDDSEEHFIATIAADIRSALPGREIHLVLENEKNEARWLARDSNGRPGLHTAQWDDDLHHCWHVLLTGESEGYYADFADDPAARLARGLAEGFVYQGQPSPHLGRERGESSAHLPPAAFISFLQNHDQIGNRAYGERLSSFAAPERLALAHAILLLSPQIPMLFMGEEWSASTPFLFFVDFSHDADLSRAVRDGRRSEFAQFAAFSDSSASAIPDPTIEATVESSRLRREEADSGDHAAVRAHIRALLALRQREVVPLLESAYGGAYYQCSAEHVIDITWNFAAGSLRLLANLGDRAIPVIPDANMQLVWRSDGLVGNGEIFILAAWQGIILKGAAS